METITGSTAPRFVRLSVAAIGLGLSVSFITGCSERPVSFSAQVQPVLQQHCLECHQPDARGYEASGLDMSSYETLMRGTRFGPIIEPGEPLTSVLNQLVEGRAHPSIAMPHGRNPLPASQIALLQDWVKQGAVKN